MLRSRRSVWVASIFSLLASGLLPLLSTSTRAQAAEPYSAIVQAYRSYDPGAVGWLRALTAERIEDAVSEATGAKPQPWHWADLRAAAMLHTEAWYLARAERARWHRSSVENPYPQPN